MFKFRNFFRSSLAIFQPYGACHILIPHGWSFSLFDMRLSSYVIAGEAKSVMFLNKD